MNDTTIMKRYIIYPDNAVFYEKYNSITDEVIARRWMDISNLSEHIVKRVNKFREVQGKEDIKLLCNRTEILIFFQPKKRKGLNDNKKDKQKH